MATALAGNHATTGLFVLCADSDLLLDRTYAMLKFYQLETVGALVEAELDALHSLFETCKSEVDPAQSLIDLLEAVLDHDGKVFERNMPLHKGFPLLPPMPHRQKILPMEEPVNGFPRTFEIHVLASARPLLKYSRRITPEARSME